jgi:aspartyl-tRNA(Asn)/glutamyl-tRNA(Gln) amidotransferase subunit A
MTAVDFAITNRRRLVSQASRAKLFEEFDVMITPTTPIPAPFIRGLEAVEAAGRLTSLTAPFNLIGFPAISMPSELTSAGMPVRLQLVSGPWREKTLLPAAYAFELATNWNKTQPSDSAWVPLPRCFPI